MNGQATRFCSLWEMWHLQQQSISTEHGKYEGQIWNELLQKAGAPLLTDKKKPQQLYKFHNNKQSKCSYGIEAFQSHSGHQNHGTGQGLYELIWVKVFIFSNLSYQIFAALQKTSSVFGVRERKKTAFNTKCKKLHCDVNKDFINCSKRKHQNSGFSEA